MSRMSTVVSEWRECSRLSAIT